MFRGNFKSAYKAELRPDQESEKEHEVDYYKLFIPG